MILQHLGKLFMRCHGLEKICGWFPCWTGWAASITADITYKVNSTQVCMLSLPYGLDLHVIKKLDVSTISWLFFFFIITIYIYEDFPCYYLLVPWKFTLTFKHLKTSFVSFSWPWDQSTLLILHTPASFSHQCSFNTTALALTKIKAVKLSTANSPWRYSRAVFLRIFLWAFYEQFAKFDFICLVCAPAFPVFDIHWAKCGTMSDNNQHYQWPSKNHVHLQTW